MTDDRNQDQEPQGRLDQARDTATQAIETARDAAGKAAQQTAATLESNPVGVLVGGLALGGARRSGAPAPAIARRSCSPRSASGSVPR